MIQIGFMKQRVKKRQDAQWHCRISLRSERNIFVMKENSMEQEIFHVFFEEQEGP